MSKSRRRTKKGKPCDCAVCWLNEWQRMRSAALLERLKGSQMKVIIAGSRDITDAFRVHRAIFDSGFTITEVVSGCARGVDRIGELYAELNDIPVKRFPADWERYGKSAGFKRNREMAKYADALIAIWDGQSRGTKMMIELAMKEHLQTYVVTV